MSGLGLSNRLRGERERRERSAAHLYLACMLYGFGLLAVVLALFLRPQPARRPVHALERGQSLGEVKPHVPRLNAEDPMANAAVLRRALDDVVLSRSSDGAPGCDSRARLFAVLIDGRLSRVRVGARVVCQLRLLKQISIAQPGFGEHGLAEVAAFLLGRRLPGGDDVDVTRVVIPPFRFSGDSLTFLSADLGPMDAGERFIGTYHTHPGGDLEQGVLSEIDLGYMQSGLVQIHWAGGARDAQAVAARLDWLFDIVEPRQGDWNVYAHDMRRLRDLHERCTNLGATQTPCPLNELRLAGSPFHLLARYYDEPSDADGF